MSGCGEVDGLCRQVACGERRSRYMGGDGSVEDRWNVVRGGVYT
jgi:hypothetical protein